MFRNAVRRGFCSSNLPIKGRLGHVAIAVPKEQCIMKAAQPYKDMFNAKVSEPFDLPEHGVTTVFVELANTKLELLHPLGESSPVGSFIKKNPVGGIHHICVEVANIEESRKEAIANGLKPLSENTKIGAHGNPVLFFHPKTTSGVLLEIEEVEGLVL